MRPTAVCDHGTGTAVSRAVQRQRFSLCALLIVVAMTGCGYIVGSGFPPEVRTIHVGAFQTDGYRRGVEFQLTEAIQKEIQKRTHFRLVNEPMADTVLTGRIVDVRKDVLGESMNDDPRELQLALMVDVTWTDRRTGRILAQDRLPIDSNAVLLQSQAEFAPEVGQSLATGLQQTTQQLARQIVDMMETPW